MSTAWDRKVKIAAEHGFELHTFYWASSAHSIGVHTHIGQHVGYYLSDGVSKVLTDEEKDRTYRRFDHALRDANRIGQR